MAGNREETLKQAERLLRQGRLDGAIAEYVRLVEEQPGDWNSMNALGDLYVRRGDHARAAAQYLRIADNLFAEGFLPKAAAVYKKALKVREGDEHTLRRLGEIALRQGLLVDAKIYLRRLSALLRARGDERGAAACLGTLEVAVETAPASPLEAARAAVKGQPDSVRLLLELARQELDDPKCDARPTLMRVLTLAPERHADVMGLSEVLAQAGRMEDAFGCVDVVSDVALLEGNVEAAIAALEALLQHVQHPLALAKLAELRSSLVPVESEPDAGSVLLDEPAPVEEPEPVEQSTLPPPTDGAIELEVLEVDLSDALAGLESAIEVPVLPERPAPDLEIVFEELRSRVTQTQEADRASEQYRRGVEALEQGRLTRAVADLEAAARAPMFRFDAAVRLGRLHVGLGALEVGVDWLERAAEAPAPSLEDGFAVLYELADALEEMGESARALAVLMELDAAAGGYKDVSARVDRLARTQAEGGAP